MSATTYKVRDGVAVIQMNNPPVNGLSHALRLAIVQDLDRALEDTAVIAIVLTGTERAFSAGADIKELGTAKATEAPVLRAVIEALEEAEKPVVAAIQGVCLGGGLELAMGAHYRIAQAGARLALPEVKLGILPGAGGTQRLPRAIGLKKALHMITTGDTVTANTHQDTDLLDQVVEDNLLAQAIQFAQELGQSAAPLKRLADNVVDDAGDSQSILAATRTELAKSQRGWPAPIACVEAVEASLNEPFDIGLRRERELFIQLVHSPESQAMRHIFNAERAALKVPGIADNTPLRQIKKVAIIGAGTMGSGISMNFIAAGIPVYLVDNSQDALDRGLATIQKNLEISVKRYRLSEEEAKQQLQLLQTCLSYDELSDVDLFIEAVFEDMAVKAKVFKDIERVAKASAILASNTSTLDINEMAKITQRPHDVVGLHFFSPAHIMKLLEVIRGDKTADDVLATVLKLAGTIGKQAVVSGVCDGFIGNRMLYAFRAAADGLMLAGASPYQIDRALEDFGFAMGPYRVADLAGLDIGYAIRKRRAEETPNIPYDPVIADLLFEAGRLGQKNGKGWYLYEENQRQPTPDPVVEEMVQNYRKDKGITARAISNREIIKQCVYLLVNEGAKILEEGIALRASDIDLVYMYGYGFPKQRGGPMNYAEQIGLFNVLRDLKRFAKKAVVPSDYWTVSPRLVEAAEIGRF